MSEQRTIKCPFCNKGDINILYTEKQEVTKYARAAGNTKRITFFRDPKTEVLTVKCPNCGKTKKEIKKRLKYGKTPTREEIIKRAKEAGLPLKF